MLRIVLSKNYKFYLKSFLLLLFCIAGVYGMIYHEFWRDEIRALSISNQAKSIFDLPNLLINEGHPALWYVLLHFSFKLTGSTMVLPILSLFFAFVIFYLLLFKSPFPILISCLIGFGFYGLYINGINCRNYGIGACLLLLFVHLKTHHPNAIYWQIIVLTLAIQTNIYMSVMSTLMAILVYTDVRQKPILKTIILPWFAIACSLLFTIYTTMPNKESNVVNSYNMSVSNLTSLWDVGFGFNEFIYNWFPYKHGFLTFILAICLLPFLKQKKFLIVLMLSLVFMNFFSLCVRHNYLHHLGMWLYFLIALLWLNYPQIKHIITTKNNYRVVYIIGVFGILFILLNNFHRGIEIYVNDIKQSKSDSKNFATWLNQHSNAKEVWISEPDYIMEPLMYYINHPFFIARENRFNTYVHFTKANDSIISLSKLLSISDSFNRNHQTTLLILEHKVHYNDSFYTYSMKRFNVDKLGIIQLEKHYDLIDSFKDNYYTDEHYFVYRKKVVNSKKEKSPFGDHS